MSVPGIDAATLTPAAIAAWDRYVSLTEARISRELPLRPAFLISSRDPGAFGDWRGRVLAGATLVRELETRDAGGRAIQIPDASVHHWLGLTFVPNMTLDTLLDLLEHRPTERWSPDVVSARLVGRRGDVAHTFLRLREKNIVTVTYDTEHEVRFVREDATHASSQSRSIRIAQIEDPDTPKEKTLPVGNDSGYLWRLNAYWRSSRPTAACSSSSSH